MAANNSEFAVHLIKDGVLHSFGPDEEFPDWVAKLVHNPLVTGQKQGTGDADAVGGDPAPASGIPPQAGAGSGRDVWAAYAEKHGVKVEDDWKRDRIIAACGEAGVAVE